MNYKEVEVEINGIDLVVELEGDCEIEDCSFSHAFGTEICFDVICNDITYDKTDYSYEEKVAIDKYIEDNFTELSEYFCDNYESPEPDYEPDYELDYEYED